MSDRLPLPRPGSLGLIQYAGVDMHAYADAVIAAARPTIDGFGGNLDSAFAAPAVPDGLRDAVNTLLHQIDIGDFVDSNGHSAKMLKPVHDLMRLMSESAAPAVPADAALNTLAKLFHSGEEIEGDDGAAMMVEMALWNEGCEALEALIGEGDDETFATPAAPAVREPQPSRPHKWQPFGIAFRCDSCGMVSQSGQENACTATGDRNADRSGTV